MDLPLLSALFLAFALALYVLLDGFDLGVGALLLLQRDERLRDRMIDAIAPTWDGNETWLIMAGVTLLAAFPIAYGILLPAFYLPLIAMLLALGLRGVSFEFRVRAGEARAHWDRVFALGSIVAAAMQGIVVGGLIMGVAVRGDAFAGTPLDVFTPFTVLTAIAVVTGYALLGAGWLFGKGEPGTARFAERACARLLPLFVALAIVTCWFAARAQPGVAAAWIEQPLPLGVAVTIFVLSAGISSGAILRSGPLPAWLPFSATLVLFASAIAGLGIAIFPGIVPFRLTLWEAASATASHMFLLIGALFVTPAVLAYSAFAYRVFRGRTPERGWAE